MSNAPKLRIAVDLALPTNAVTETIVIYGGKGMGKTNLGAVLAEELALAGQRFAVIDPMGVFWGLRHSEDGKGPGIEVLILGGRHGDLPIEPTAGAVVADLVADEATNVVIDISRHPDGKMWSVGERIRFVADYCSRLYERQGERSQPLMQIIDECGRFAPQQIPHGAVDVARCVGAVERMVEEGRNVGIGVCLITQRSARMNKSVSELAECMIAFRTVGPRSIDAILDWLGEHVEKPRWKELLAELRTLPRGTALVVSPGWLQFEGVVEMRRRQTFDSSATPKAGKERRASGVGAKLDLERYKQHMAATIERAEATDPTKLQRKLAEALRANEKLATALMKAQSASPSSPASLASLAAANAAGYNRAAKVFVGRLAKMRRPIEELINVAVSVVHRAADIQSALNSMAEDMAAPVIHQHDPRGKPLGMVTSVTEDESGLTLNVDLTKAGASRIAASKESSNGQLGQSGLRRMLIALAQRPNLSVQQLGVRAGLSSGSGTFGNYLSKARVNGWIEGSRNDLRITQAGLDALGSYEALPTGQELLRYWLTELGAGSGMSRMLMALAEARKPMSAEELGKVVGFSPSSGTFGNYLSKLRRLELISGDRSQLVASDELFD